MSKAERDEEHPEYQVLRDLYDDCLTHTTTIPELDTDKSLSLNERAIRIFETRNALWKDMKMRVLRDNASRLKKMYGDDSEEYWIRLEICFRSLTNRGLSAAGSTLEQIICYFLTEMGVEAQRGRKRNGRKKDITVRSNVTTDKKSCISCKTTVRDKFNDSNDEAQLCYRAEMPEHLVKDFANSKQIIIVVLPQSREEILRKARIAKVNISVHDIDTGLSEFIRQYQPVSSDMFLQNV